jgi:serine/threonine-protein kinase
VTVFVSSGAAPVTVPNVIGLDQVAATQQLSQAGFDVSKTNQASSSVDAGNVISTNPTAGSPAPKGSAVTIFVSTGPEQAKVPNVVGQTQSAATNTLTDAGFNVTVVQVPSNPSSAGKVIAQNPTAGQNGSKGDTVVITIGNGPTTTTSS